MQLGKDWKIESDSMNIILKRRRVVKKKDRKEDSRDPWNVEGYFSNVQNAMKFMADIKLLESEFKDMKAITKKQEEIYKLIQSITTKPTPPVKTG